ncbi:MAG: SurA N-terminal domain-containing protein [Nitrospirae bacterium]|nr:SurA N-terminal domain-containing protein [Nitrospirota bacterium]MBI3594010.1 SurA N-terminal domain-containing protein [Nitrospirota bacterium]
MNKVISRSHFSPFLPILLILIGGIFLSFSISSCKKKQIDPLSKTLVVVGGEKILDSDLNQAIAEIGSEMPVPQGEALDRLKSDLLDQLIQTRTFLQEAKRKNIQVSKSELDDFLTKSKAEYSENDFNELLKGKGLTYERWVQKISDNMIIQKLEEKATETVPEPTPDEIKEFYNSHLDDYKLKPGVRIRQILVGTEKEAREIRSALVKGADFAKLALERSISPDKDLGGDLGILTKDQMPEGFEVTLSLPINTISPIIKTSYGYHIFRVEGKQNGKISSLSEEAPRIRTLLFQERRDKEFAKWAIDLRKRTDIQILPDALNVKGIPK